jgi:hypothetical protein
MMARVLNTDVVSGVLGLAITLVFYSARENWTPLSAQWPNAILIFMGACSLLLIAKGLIAATRWPVFDEGNPRRMVWAMGLLVLWGVLLPRLGFILTSIGMFYAFWFVVGQGVLREQNDSRQFPLLAHLRVLVVASMLVMGSHWLFSKILFVPLPRGFLGW